MARLPLLAVALVVSAVGCRQGERSDARGAPAEPRADDSRREAREARSQAEAPEATPRAGRQRRVAEKAHTVRHVAGRLEEASGQQVIIRAPGEPRLTLRVSSLTAVTVDGRPSRLESLQRGTDVRASYQTGGGARPTALAIEVRSGGADPPPPGPTPDARRAPSTGDPGSRGGG
jgi:hypothetical protein